MYTDMSNLTEVIVENEMTNLITKESNNENTTASQLINAPLTDEEPTAKTFKMRICKSIDQNSSQNPQNCNTCGLEIDNLYLHKGIEREGLKQWNKIIDKCTTLKETNAYGKLRFHDSSEKISEYIRVAVDKDNNYGDNYYIDRMYRYMLNENGFNLSKPQLLLSITGGSKDFEIDEKTERAFKSGLMKAAKTTNAWITTSGTNCGIIKVVGDAVADDLQGYEHSVIGITAWGCVERRENLIRPSEILDGKHEVDYSITNTPNELNPNHSKFILVDNGTTGRHRVEIPFRDALEQKIKKEAGGLMVLFVVGGGIATLDTIKLALEKKTPVIIIANTGRCADTVKKAKEKYKNIKHGEIDLTNDDLKYIGLKDEEYEEYKKVLEIILNKSNNEYITILDILDDENNFENAIYEAIFKAETDLFKRAKLAIKCNQIHIVEKYLPTKTTSTKKNYKENEYEASLNTIFDDSIRVGDKKKSLLKAIENADDEKIMNESDIFKIEEDFKNVISRLKNISKKEKENTGQNIKYQVIFKKLINEIKYSRLYELLEHALVENKPESVALMLDKKSIQIDLKNFLTKDRIDRLYNYETEVEKKIKYSEPFRVYLQQNNQLIDKKHYNQNSIQKFLEKYFYFIDFQLLTHYDKQKNGKCNGEILKDDRNHEFYLFIWCILSNRIELAKIFWRVGKYQLCTAMIASKILKILSEELHDFKEQLEEKSKEFEDLAIGLIQLYDRNTHDVVNDVLIIRYTPLFKMDCLELAVHCQCETFLSSAFIQNILTDIWNNKKYKFSDLTGQEKQMHEAQKHCNMNQNYMLSDKVYQKS